MKEDYELISTKPTRTSKVRQLDITDIQGEEFARVIVQKLKDNTNGSSSLTQKYLCFLNHSSLNFFHNKKP